MCVLGSGLHACLHTCMPKHICRGKSILEVCNLENLKHVDEPKFACSTALPPTGRIFET